MARGGIVVELDAAAALEDGQVCHHSSGILSCVHKLSGAPRLAAIFLLHGRLYGGTATTQQSTASLRWLPWDTTHRRGNARGASSRRPSDCGCSACIVVWAHTSIWRRDSGTASSSIFILIAFPFDLCERPGHYSASLDGAPFEGAGMPFFKGTSKPLVPMRCLNV